MKHEKEWYTCDRCGKEIKEDIYAWKKVAETVFRRIPYYEYLKIRENMPYRYIHGLGEKSNAIPPIIAVEITKGYNKNEKTIHLCGKCRKEFERFMSGK